jgi:ubiquinone/menaquinone biosynthesis C-methylase UbiE
VNVSRPENFVFRQEICCLSSGHCDARFQRPMSFDTLAPFYRWMERVFAGDKMQSCRVAFLEDIPVPAAILLLGEGPGRFLVPAVARFPEAAITCVDSSAGMIARARRSLAEAMLPDAAVRFVQTDIFEWSPPPASFDLVVTQFFLDCFRADQLRDLIATVARAAAPGADWLVADFQHAPAGWRRLRTRAIISFLYAFFRVMTLLPGRTLVPPGPFLQAAGFSLHRRIESDFGLLRSDWWRRNG